MDAAVVWVLLGGCVPDRACLLLTFSCSFESRDICDEIIKKFHGKPVGAENLPLQVRYADTSAQKRLKATTTKKRQYRANEYNNIVNGGFWNMPPHHHLRGGNRFWLRQNSIGSSG